MKDNGKKPFLTIGILAYNKKPYLKLLLDQIIVQVAEGHLEKELEVVVSDNASTDGTMVLMKRYLDKHLSYLRYNRNPKNLGFSGNILKQVELARGKYLWFMGDDELLDDGIVTLLNILKSYKKEKIFLMSIENKYPLKTELSNLEKSHSFIMRNGANMTTNVIPVKYAKIIRQDLIEKNEVNKIWTHTQVCMCISLEYDIPYVLVDNTIFTYCSHFPRKESRATALGHLINRVDFYDLIRYIDNRTGSHLLNTVPRAFDLMLLIPFLDAFNPKDSKEVKEKILYIRDSCNWNICYLTYALLLVPHGIRRVLGDIAGSIIFYKKYGNLRKRLK